MKPTVFISYRRNDISGHARLMYASLSRCFDNGVFFDHASISEGTVFSSEITDAIEAVQLVMVLIGPGWVSELNGRVGAEEIDFVRREVVMALQRKSLGKTVVLPVVLGGAATPALHHLDESLRPELADLFEIDMFVLGDGKQAKWDNELDGLITRIEELTQLRALSRPGNEKAFNALNQRVSPHYADLQGRVAELHARLTTHGSVAVHGMGGLGKTQLALKFSHEYRERYVGVWWLRAESVAVLEDDAKRFCGKVGATIRGSDSAGTALAKWLGSASAPWLIVYDNVEDLSTIEKCVPDLQRHHIVFTSRNPAIQSMVPAGGAMALKTWTKEQAADFLQQRNARGSREQQVDLGWTLGGLPLALDQAAGYLVANGVGLSTYLAMYRHAAGELLASGRAAGYALTVESTLSLSLEKLTPEAKELVGLLAHAAPEPVPESWFATAGAMRHGSLAVAAADPLRWDRVASELHRYAFASRGAAEDVPTFTLHRLTLEVLRLRFKEKLESWIQLLQFIESCNSDSAVHWPQLAPHILVLWGRRGEYGDMLKESVGDLALRLMHQFKLESARFGTIRSRESSERGDFVELLLSYNHHVSDKKMHEVMRRSWLTILESRRRSRMADQPQQPISVDRLAQAQKMLKESRHSFGAEHPNSIAHMDDLAIVHWDQGDVDEACKLLKQALKVRRRRLGSEHVDTLESMSALALMYKRQGRLSRARKLEEHVLKARQSLLGAAHQDTRIAIQHLIQTLDEQHDQDGVRALWQQLLDMYEQQGEHDNARMLRMRMDVVAQNKKSGRSPIARRIRGWLRQLRNASHYRRQS